MRQSKILIDTCSYIRLAKNIHPLLNKPFGDKNYCLYIIKDFQKDYSQGSRLQNEFPWLEHDEYSNNRKKPISVSNRDKREIENTLDIFLNIAGDDISLVDIKYLSHAHVLKIPLVTDDKEMLEFAQEFEIEALNTLELLKLMFDSKHISMNDVRSVISYLIYINDLPANFKNDYILLFGEDPHKVYSDSFD